MEPNVSPRSVDDPRSRRYSVSFPIEIELFYAVQGEFVRDASTTRAMEQFLIDRATAAENIEDLRRRILFKAESQGKVPRQLIEEFLTKHYSNVQGLIPSVMAIALCKLWNLPID